MRVVVDVAPLSHLRTGVGNYIRGSLRGIVAASAGEHEVVAFAPVSRAGRRVVLDSLDGIDIGRHLPVVPLAHAVRTAWSRLGTPPVERAVGGLDVFHFSDWMYPSQRAGVRSTMVHDLVPLHHPEWAHARTRRMHGAKYRHTAQSCDAVVVNSRFTAEDVADTLAVPRDRIHVAYPGVDERLTPDGPKEPGEYVLAVGTLEPRKNLARIAAAVEGELRVVGARGWGGVEPPANVRWLGEVPDAELAALYRGARCLVYASLYEGFGIPVAEALACGCAVVTSRGTPMAELGDAVLVDPLDVSSIREGIARAQPVTPRRGASWTDVARATRAVYEELA